MLLRDLEASKAPIQYTATRLSRASQDFLRHPENFRGLDPRQKEKVMGDLEMVTENMRIARNSVMLLTLSLRAELRTEQLAKLTAGNSRRTRRAISKL